MKRDPVDPEYARYRKKYPKPPSVETCVDLLGRGNVQGSRLEGVLHDLATWLPDHGAAIVAAFRAESDRRVRSLVLSVLAEAGCVEGLAVFAEALRGEDEDLRVWAARGLYRMDTPDSRRALRQARTAELGDSTETARFREMLDDVARWKWR